MVVVLPGMKIVLSPSYFMSSRRREGEGEREGERERERETGGGCRGREGGAAMAE